MSIASLVALVAFGTYPDTISHRITFTENQLSFEEIQGYLPDEGEVRLRVE